MNRTEKAVADLERCPHCGAAIEVYARSCPTCGRDVFEEKLSVFKKQRDTGAMTEAAFDVVERLLRGPDVALSETAPRSAIRKQVTALVPDDLERFSIWEFALDEEGEEGQDEARYRRRYPLRRLRFTARGGVRRVHPADDRYQRGTGELLVRPLRARARRGRGRLPNARQERGGAVPGPLPRARRTRWRRPRRGVAGVPPL